MSAPSRTPPAADRLYALRRSGLLTGSGREAFGHLTEHLRLVLGVPVAIVSIVDEHRQVFAGHCGLPEPWASLGETPITHSFCQHVVEEAAPFIVNDANCDATVKDNPAIADLGVIAYLGVPICLPGGEVAGALAAIDTQPRAWTAHDERVLRSVADIVERDIRLGVSELKYQSVISDMREGFYVARAERDGDGTVADMVMEEINPAYTRLTGLTPERIVGKPLSQTVPRALEDLLPAFQSVVDGRVATVYVGESRSAPGRVFETRVEPLDGERVAGFFSDVTERESAQDQQAVLNREISHRLKNTLAMVQALAFQTLRAVPDQTPVQAFERRLMALSTAHDILFRQHWHRAPLETIAETTLSRVCPMERIRIQGPEVSFASKATLAAAMLLHELGANAVKYGALSTERGYVALSWEVNGSEQDATLTLTWRECDGPVVQAPTHRGFGSRLIRLGLGNGSKVDIAFNPEGLVVTMSAALPPLEQIDL